MIALAIVRVICAMIVDLGFFAGALYAGHLAIIPKEAAIAVCTALVVHRVQTTRNQTANGTPPDQTVGPGSAAMALLGMFGFSGNLFTRESKKEVDHHA